MTYKILKNKIQESLDSRIILGLYEYVTIKGKKVPARIDSGAVKSSIDINLAAELKLGPVVGTKKIRNVHGSNVRPVVSVGVKLCKKSMKADFTLQHRKSMKFKVLIGQNILFDHFIIDPKKTILKKVKD
jgi:hypothetical protein